jgi:hypothetical protein
MADQEKEADLAQQERLVGDFEYKLTTLDGVVRAI